MGEQDWREMPPGWRRQWAQMCQNAPGDWRALKNWFHDFMSALILVFGIAAIYLALKDDSSVKLLVGICVLFIFIRDIRRRK